MTKNKQEKLLAALQIKFSTLSNKQMFEWMLDAQSPDDYGGGFTEVGYLEKDASRIEIERRLKRWLKR